MNSSALFKIPAPKYYILYNGNEKKPDMMHLKLSDSFTNNDRSGDFEWTATMININYGHNKELMDSCKILKEYSVLINKIRNYIKNKYDVD